MYYQDAGEPLHDYSGKCIVAAKEVGCKLASAERVQTELGLVPVTGKVVAEVLANQTCREVNAAAIDTAYALLANASLSGSAGANTLARFQASGRPFCLAPDKAAESGPNFIDSPLQLVDNGTCLVVTAISLGPTSVKIPFGDVGGTHYCKLLSPARALDFMMTDALKNISTCLNTER